MRRLAIFMILMVGLALAQIDQIPPLKFETVDGERTSVSELLGRGPLVIDFWALWCAPCLKAMRFLDELSDRYGEEGFQVLAVNLDSERSRSKVRNYVRSKGYNFIVALDPAQESFRRTNGNSLPYTLVVDKSGTIVYRHIGYVPGDENRLEKEILTLLTDNSRILPSSSH